MSYEEYVLVPGSALAKTKANLSPAAATSWEYQWYGMAGSYSVLIQILVSIYVLVGSTVLTPNDTTYITHHTRSMHANSGNGMSGVRCALIYTVVPPVDISWSEEESFSMQTWEYLYAIRYGIL